MNSSRRSLFLVFAAILLAGFSLGMIIFRQESASFNDGSSKPSSFSSGSDTTDKRKEQDSLFRQYLKNGEEFYLRKDLNQAIIAFEKAQKIKPNDARLKERIIRLKELVSEENRKRNEYQKALVSGDAYFNTKDYLNAKASYQVAIDNRPDDSLAKEKLRKTMDLLRSLKAQNILYDVAVASADKLYQEKDYDRARAEYENASRILPQEQYPRDKINEIIKIQIGKQVNDELYAKAISNGDKFFLAKSYQSSLLEFQKAQNIRPEEPYPKQKIAELTTLIAAQKARDDAYNKAILLADQLFLQTKYTESVKGYRQALTIKPDEVYPKNRIREIENLLAGKKREQSEYDYYITLADSLYIGKNYLRARENYTMASSVKPTEAYPKEMIAKADKMLTGREAAMAKAMDEQWTIMITTADKLLKDKSFEQARAEYVKASLLKPAERYPLEKIQEIDKFLADQKAVDEQYRLTIANADKMFGQKNYDPAKTEYQKATGYKPAETYPKMKIAEIDSILNDLLQAKSREEQYKSLLVSADKELAALDYEQAKTDYQKALALKPAEYYPKSKIAEIDRILLGINQQKAVDEKYRSIIYNADSLLAVKAYEQARTEYQNALKIKPAEVHPKDRLTEITQILALIAKEKTLRDQYSALITQGESQMQTKQYSLSRTSFEQALSLKPEEKLPKEKIAAIDSILADLAKQKALDDQYKSVVANADKLLASKMLEQARSEYVNAGNLKPAEQYPRDKIAEIDKMLGDLAAKKALDEQYAKTITDADKLFAEKSYDQAKTLYVNAGGLKPAEVYPRNRIAEIDRILAEIAKLKALDEQYAATIVNADKLLGEKSYEPAKVEYQKASGLKPAEQYPKTKIAEIDKALADLAGRKAIDEQYASAIAAADKFFGAKDYDQAGTTYTNAGRIKPAEQYPKDKLAEIATILADLAKQKALDDQYKSVVANADKLLASKMLEQARSEYVNAGNLKPAEQYPRDKIAEIDKMLGDLAAKKALDEQYVKFITDADKLFAEKSYDQAKALYVNAGGLKPAEVYPRNRIAEIDRILAEIAKQKALDEQYAATIVNADKLLGEKSYEPAKVEYQKASGLKPAEQYPKTKIAEIDKALADLAGRKAIDEQYASAIAAADKFFGAKDYDQARTTYTNAGRIKPAEQYPKDKLAEIATILADLAKQKALDDQYKSVVANADKLLASKMLEQARSEYVNAGNLKPAEQYPRDKIAEIDKMLGDLAAKKALDEQYAKTITDADKLFAEKSYDQAKALYVNAGGLKPAEVYPRNRIAEIDRILAEIAKQKALDEQYAATIVNADKLLGEKSYEPAKVEYQKASGLKPAEQYPKTKIAEIDKALTDLAGRKAIDEQYASAIAAADKFFGSKEYDQARTTYTNAGRIKPAEQYPKDKLAEITSILAEIAKQKVLDEEYAATIVRADKLLGEKTFDLARIEYQKASGLKPAEQYPKTKIDEIDKLLGEIAAQKALNEQYVKFIADADKLFNMKSYDQAKALYVNAGGLKPAEVYPRNRIAEIDRILAEIAKQKALDEQYAATIVNADKLLGEKSYEPAKVEYQKASGLKPAEQYPKTKIAEIDKALTDLAGRKAIDEQYASAIAAADKFFGSKEYDQARTTYTNAGRIKPAEQYPKDKLAEITSILAEIAKQKVLDDQYKSIIARGDQLLGSKSYELAKTEYINAGKLKPSEQYPKDKIIEIDGILSELKAKEEAYKASVTKADQLLAGKKYDESSNEYQNALTIKPEAKYPADKIAEINRILTELKGKRQTYDELVARGDGQLNQKEWMKAKGLYQQALTIFPLEAYPKDKISQIEFKIDSIYRANKARYDQAVAEGDRFYNAFEYDKAIDSYTVASELLPMENYPREMISKIRRTIAENAIVDVLKTPVTIAAGEEKQFPFTPVNMASRKNNFVYIKIRNLSNKPFNILMRYGQDKQPGGGVVIRNLNADGKVNERLISVRDQDAWYRTDNNWISLYPQGGDVEVTFIQVSRAQKQ